MKLLILKGLPASGKSTWAKQYCSKNKDWVRINRDDLRNMRGEYWIPKQETLITEWEDSCVILSLKQGLNVILDSTNLNKDRNKYRVEKLKVDFPDLVVEYKFFDISLEDCIKRDLKRVDSVGESVIRNMYDKYLAPENAIYKEDESLERAVIFDVDGTLAEMYNRSPYDWHKVGFDLPKMEVIRLAKLYKVNGFKLIIFTGRDGSCLSETQDWLLKNGVDYDEVHIRPEGNNEKDSVIKKELFEKNIRGKYYVELVVDDRNQVVDMWRKELGLTCLQVNYGDF